MKCPNCGHKIELQKLQKPFSQDSIQIYPFEIVAFVSLRTKEYFIKIRRYSPKIEPFLEEEYECNRKTIENRFELYKFGKKIIRQLNRK